MCPYLFVFLFIDFILQHSIINPDIHKTYLTHNTVKKLALLTNNIPKVFDNVKDRFVLGYKPCTFFDGKTTIPCDFSLHQEKGNKEIKLYIGLGSYQSCDLND